MFGFFKKDDVKVAGTVAVGCGGGGCNIAGRLAKISAVDILTVNTDRKGLVRSRSDLRILLGDGNMDAGCGGDAALGRKLTKDAQEMINNSIGRYLNVVLLAGLGGGTGTGAAEAIAELAKDNGSRVIILATIPMSFESDRRAAAREAVAGLAKVCDIVVIIDGDRLIEIDPMLGAREAFSVLDQMICESFMGIMEMLEGNRGESVFQAMKGNTFSVSFSEGMSAGKVADVLSGGLMAASPAVSEPMIFVRGTISADSGSKITEKVKESLGIEPVLVQGPEGKGMNLVMFVPIDPSL